MDNCNSLIEFLATSSGINKEDIERRIEAKRAKLSGLISKEGAAQIIAAELGINFDKQSIKIIQIVPGMKKINLSGKIITLYPVKEFNKNGKSGKIGSFILADDTSNIRVVLWDENHIELISNGRIKENHVIEINNASLRNGELHLGSFSDIKISDKSIDKVILEKPLIKKQIFQFNTNEMVKTRAFILQMFEPRFFEICPECKKKVSEIKECLEHGKVVPEKRALLNFVIDDGTDSIRAVIFSDQLEKIMSKGEIENPELFSIKKESLLGKEVLISGHIRKNKLYDNNEFIVLSVDDVNLDQLIDELER
jgi:ssDNA-binding replication factor A large subunit